MTRPGPQPKVAQPSPDVTDRLTSGPTGMAMPWIAPERPALDASRIPAYKRHVLTLEAKTLDVDVVGDIHGCAEELFALLTSAGYEIAAYQDRGDTPIGISHPQGRKLVFVGDLTDRGPRPDLTLRLTMGLVQSGAGYAVMGNHDWKIYRWLIGRKVSLTPNARDTIAVLLSLGEEFLYRCMDLYVRMPHQICIPVQKLDHAPGATAIWITHGAAPEALQGKETQEAFDRAIYGLPTGEVLPDGRPIREDWALSYTGMDPVIHGHVVQETPYRMNRVIGIDTGCAHGGALCLYHVDSDSTLLMPALKTVDPSHDL